MKKISDLPLYAIRIKLASIYQKYLQCKWYQFSKKYNLWTEAQELEKIIKQKQAPVIVGEESINHKIY